MALADVAMTPATLSICLLAAACELSALVLIVQDAQRPVVRCAKPWLSYADERAACAIEDALTRLHAGRERPAVELRTGWRKG